MLTINQIQLEEVDAILAQQGEAKEWGKREHIAFLRRLAVRFGMDPAKAKEFAAILAENGAGANASQFRQWLEKPADKNGPARLSPNSSAKLGDYN